MYHSDVLQISEICHNNLPRVSNLTRCFPRSRISRFLFLIHRCSIVQGLLKAEQITEYKCWSYCFKNWKIASTCVHYWTCKQQNGRCTLHPAQTTNGLPYISSWQWLIYLHMGECPTPPKRLVEPFILISWTLKRAANGLLSAYLEKWRNFHVWPHCFGAQVAQVRVSGWHTMTYV